MRSVFEWTCCVVISFVLDLSTLVRRPGDQCTAPSAGTLHYRVPHHALYVPVPLLKQGLNFAVLLELEPREMAKGSLATIQLTDRPDFTHA